MKVVVTRIARLSVRAIRKERKNQDPRVNPTRGAPNFSTASWPQGHPSEVGWMVLDAQDVGLEEGISSAMPERIVDQESAAKQSEWEIKFRGGDDVAFECYC
jgi:hypothetical protein